MKEKYDLMIVGGGIAGMTAAIYAARQGWTVAVAEKEMCGGQIIGAPRVDNYPGCPGISGAELAQRLMEQVQDAGAEILSCEVTGAEREKDGFQIHTTTGECLTHRLLLAVGAAPRKLGLAGEERLMGHGISYCVTCDGPFFRDKCVAVAGGGDAAVSAALTLAEYCREVHLLHRSPLRAQPALTDRLRREARIVCHERTIVTGLIGDERLTAVSIRTGAEEKEHTLQIPGLFVEIGHIPATAPFADLVTPDDTGYFVTAEHCCAAPGIFAAGDCRRKEIRQLTTAAADGTVAAMAAIKPASAAGENGGQTRGR